MNNDKKYDIHPGLMLSKHDGEVHYISAIEIARLHKIKNYIVWDRERPETYSGRNIADYNHIYPNNYIKGGIK